MVRTFAGGALVALIDALGHGIQAAHAARVAAETLARSPHKSPVELIERCHAAMQRTRGAAISLASFDWHRRTVTWLGVGNVAGVLVHAGPDTGSRMTPLLVRGGVTGDRLPDLQASVIPLAAETSLIAATDGVREDFTDMLTTTALDPNPQRLADRILVEYAREDDDATVLVFYCGGRLCRT